MSKKRLDADTAFDLLLEELHKIDTSDPKNYERLKRLRKKITDIRKKDWAKLRNRLQAAGKQTKGKNLPPGFRTPSRTFYVPILKILNSAGGKMPARDVLAALPRSMSLNDYDKEPLRTGEIRWRNTARFARNELAIKGCISRDIPGIWTITTQGTNFLRNNK